MAKIYNEQIVINVQRLIKDDQIVGTLLAPDLVNTIEQVAEELFDSAAVVEIELPGEKDDDAN